MIQKRNNQSSYWEKNPEWSPLQKVRRVKNHIKSMLIVFYDQQGNRPLRIYTDRTDSKPTSLRDILRWLGKDLRQKRPESWTLWEMVFHSLYDNVEVSVQQFITITNMDILPHPLYLPDHSPCDYFHFLKVKLKGQAFQVHGRSLRHAIGPYRDLINTARKRKLRWYIIGI